MTAEYCETVTAPSDTKTLYRMGIKGCPEVITHDLGIACTALLKKELTEMVSVSVTRWTSDGNFNPPRIPLPEVM